MATFHRNEKGIGYFKLTWSELCEYSLIDAPVCDGCNDRLLESDEIMLIPIHNQAYCPKCAPETLRKIVNYPEDRHIEERRERFYADYFGVPLEVT